MWNACSKHFSTIHIILFAQFVLLCLHTTYCRVLWVCNDRHESVLAPSSRSCWFPSAGDTCPHYYSRAAWASVYGKQGLRLTSKTSQNQNTHRNPTKIVDEYLKCLLYNVLFAFHLTFIVWVPNCQII